MIEGTGARSTESASALIEANIITLHPIPFAALCLLTIWAAIISRRWSFGLIIFGMALLSPEVSDLVRFNGVFDGLLNEFGSLARFAVYTCVALIVSIFILPFRSLSKSPTVWIITLLMLEALLGIFGGTLSIFGLVFEDYFVSPLNSFAYLAILAMLRGLVKIWQENRTIRTDLRKTPNLQKLKLQTWSLWMPMGLTFIALMGAGFYWQNQILRPAIINQIVDFGNAHRHTQACGFIDRLPIRTIPKALDAYARSGNCVLQQETDRLHSIAPSETRNLGESFEDYGRSRLPKRFPGTQRKSCNIGNFVECTSANIAKGIFNSGYLVAKEAFLRDVRLKTEELSGTVTERQTQIQTAINARLDALTAKITLRIYQAGAALSLLQAMLFAYAVLVLVKSWLIVYARVIYNTISISREVGDVRIRKTPGKIKVHGAQTRLKPGVQKRWYFAFNVLGPNAIDMRRIPQVFSIILLRLRTSRYMLCRVDGVRANSPHQVELKVDAPGSIVEWEINEGEEVYINLRDLIGFQSNCKLGWRVSFHISSLVFGRVLYYTVSVPSSGSGTIYLATKAEALAGNGPNASAIMHATALVAWSRNCQFKIRSSLTRLDMFFSGYSISKDSGRRFLVAYDKSQDRRVGAGRGLWRSAVTFLLPF